MEELKAKAITTPLKERVRRIERRQGREIGREVYSTKKPGRRRMKESDHELEQKRIIDIFIRFRKSKAETH